MRTLARGEDAELKRQDGTAIVYPIGKAGKKGYGFLHIVEARMVKDGATLDEAIDIAMRVADAAENGEEVNARMNTRHYEKDGEEVIVAFQADGRNPIITGYEIADEKGGANRRPPSLPTSPHVSSAEVVAALQKRISELEQAVKPGKTGQSEISGSPRWQVAANNRDAEYADAVARGDTETIQRLENEAYKRAGYSPASDYQGTSAFNGAAPFHNDYFDTKEERIEAWENGEFDGTMTLGDYKDGIDITNLQFLVFDPRAYSQADEMRQEAIRNIRTTLNTGKRTITMYRSVPDNVKEAQFRNGDWITPSKAYAEDNAKLHGWDKWRIIEQEVDIENVWWDGNDIAEWGFDDGKESVYQNTPANRKLTGPTYDDAGNLIPLSKRFDRTNPDIRWKLATFPDGTPFVDITAGQELFADKPKNEWPKIARAIILEQFRNKVLGTGDRRTFVNKESAEEYAYPRKHLKGAELEGKMRTSPELDNIIDAGTNPRHVDDDGHHPEAKGGWEYRDVIFHVADKFFKGKINIMLLDEDGKRRLFHDVTDIKQIAADDTSARHGENPLGAFSGGDNNDSTPADTPSRPSVTRNIYSNADLAAAWIAAKQLGGETVPATDKDKMLSSLGITGDKAREDIQARADILTGRNRGNLQRAAENRDPELLTTLAKQSLQNRYSDALLDAITKGAKANDPEIGAAVERAKARHIASQLNDITVVSYRHA